MPIELGALLDASGAILRGHFVLTSGRHSDVYFEKFRVLERPDVLSALCKKIADHFRPQNIEVVAGPTTGGIIVAFEVARQLAVPALYVESEQGQKTLRRGANIAEGARVLVVDDVLTTGLSVKEVKALLDGRGANVVGAAVLIDRSESPIDFGCESYAAYKVTAKSYAPEEVPDWLAQVPIVKPGTRPGQPG
ncbi:MAG: orotate phosphoribosyltransferase [Fimbriimonadales bacterium]